MSYEQLIILNDYLCRRYYETEDDAVLADIFATEMVLCYKRWPIALLAA